MKHLIKNNQRVARFGAVGIINTLIDFGLLFFLKSLGLPVGAANVISTGITFLFSFVANRKFTFRSDDGSITRQFILFIAITLFGLWLIQTAIIQLTLPWLSALFGNTTFALFVAKAIATSVTLVWNYLLYNKVVFKDSL